MGKLWALYCRELGSMLGRRWGAQVLAGIWLVSGLLFNVWAVGSGHRTADQVIEGFLYCHSGIIMVAAILVAMRLFTEDRQGPAWALVATAPLSDAQIVVGKFAAGTTLLALANFGSLYLPAWVLARGSTAYGQLAAGMLGLMLLAAACLALGAWAAVLADSAVTAVFLGGTFVMALLLLWLGARGAPAPWDQWLAALSLHDRHFRPFMQGLVVLQNVAYYLSVCTVALVATTGTLAARRWQ